MAMNIDPSDVHQSSVPQVKPMLRGALHQHAISASLTAGALLVATARDRVAKLSCAVYVTSLVALFTASAVYHRPTWSPPARAVMRKLDHASIFLLIAGTYTPIAVVGLGGGLGSTLLRRVWAGAFAGVVQSTLWPKAPKMFATSIYIALGWTILPYTGEMGDALGQWGASLVVLGGLVYSIGGLIYVLQWPDPSPKVFGYHEIFHALVILASTLHFAAVYLLVLHAEA